MKHTAWISLLPLVTFSCLIPLTAKAQVTPDGTTSTTVNQDGNNFTINQGDRRGDNLFHSFDEFSVPTLGSAAFNNVNSIANIFSRVTGSSISNIDGLISANGAANLFLINPNGIIFGQNASLNLGGSFFASTADSLLFEGDTEFSAVNPQAPPLLEVSIPIGARFRDNPKDIVNQSAINNVGLQVLSGKNLTLLGGDINFETGRATARGGSIYLGGLAEAGIVNIDGNGSLSFSENITKADVDFFNRAIIDVASEEGGLINIDAHDINLFDGSRIIGGLIATGVDIPNAESGDININAANDVTLDGINTATNLNSAIQNNVESEAVGNSGDININAKNLFVNNGAQIQTLVRRRNFREQGLGAGNGNAGNINIDVSDAVAVSGISDVISFGGLETSVPSIISSSLESGAIGKAGAILITSDSLALNDGGQIISSTAGIGDAGNLTFRISKEFSLDGGIQTIQLGIPVPATSTVFSTVEAGGVGNGGIIDIQAQNLSVTGGAQIQSIVRQGNPRIGIVAGKGIAGDININVEEAVTVSGISEVLNFGGAANSSASLISSSLDIGTTGKAGTISINSDSLTLTDGGQIISSTFGIGDAGKITLNTENDINLSGINLTVNINEGISGGIFSTVESGAEGNGGIIDIQARNLSLKDGGRIETTVRQSNPQFGRAAGNGDAGNININVDEAVIISGVSEVFNVNGLESSYPSFILSALNLGAIGKAGEISITSNSLLLNDGGQITASTAGIGDAGNIDLDVSKNINLNGATEFLAQGNSFIASSAVFSTVEAGGEGNGGVVDIRAENLSLTNGGQVSATAEGQGKAGDISVNADESIFISGRAEDSEDSSGIFASAEVDNGIAGSIDVSTNQLTINDDSRISVSSEDGLAGNLNITANSLYQNAGNITSETRVSDGDTGANINLEIFGTWRIENESLVSATAFSNADGGNVNINQNVSNTEFLLLAFPPTSTNGSDITANAVGGDGGRIKINAAGFFGIDFRDEQTPLNDFTVTSEFGQSGETIINRTFDDPTSGLINLPASVGDASDQISQNPCEQGVGSQFIVTGKGGIPPTVSESLNSEAAQVDLIEPIPSPTQTVGENGDRPTAETNTEAVPAMGWVFNDRGEVTLTAYSTSDNEIQRAGQKQHRTCSSRNTP